MSDEQKPDHEKDFIEPEATLERLTDVLNQVLALPPDEGLDMVIRAQVERAGAARQESEEVEGAPEPE